MYYAFGLQRSGTNFLETLFKLNYGQNTMNSQRFGSWKHSINIPKAYNFQLPTVIIHKNPYTWVESIAMRNHVDWLKTQNTYPADQHTFPELQIGNWHMNVTNLAKTYRHFHLNWLDRYEIPKYLVIRYEDLLVDTTRNFVMQQVETTFEWKRENTSIIVPSKGAVSQSKDYNDERQSYYLSGEPSFLTDRQIEEINNVVGRGLIMKMGYQIL